MTGQTRSSELFSEAQNAFRAFKAQNAARTLELAKAIIDEGGECGVPKGLAAILGIDPARDDAKFEKPALIINNNPLGRIALFDRKGALHSIGVLSDTPLVTKLEGMFANTSVESRRFTVAAHFDWAMTWEMHGTEPELLPDYFNPVKILQIQNDEGTIHESDYNLSVERVPDASTAFSLLAKDDERAPKILNAFFEELIARSAQSANNLVVA